VSYNRERGEVGDDTAEPVPAWFTHLLLPKKDGRLRLVVDYRRLITVTAKNADSFAAHHSNIRFPIDCRPLHQA